MLNLEFFYRFYLGFSYDMLYVKFMCFITAFIMLCVFVESLFLIPLLTTVLFNFEIIILGRID